MPHRRLPEVRGQHEGGKHQHSHFIALVAGLTLILASVTTLGTNGVFHLVKLNRQKAVLTERAFELLQRNAALRTQLMRLRNDDYYLETLAREKRGLVGDREIVYRFAAPLAVPAPRPTRVP